MCLEIAYQLEVLNLPFCSIDGVPGENGRSFVPETPSTHSANSFRLIKLAVFTSAQAT